MVEFEDDAVSKEDVRAVLLNSPLDLGWFRVWEPEEKD